MTLSMDAKNAEIAALRAKVAQLEAERDAANAYADEQWQDGQRWRATEEKYNGALTEARASVITYKKLWEQARNERDDRLARAKKLVAQLEADRHELRALRDQLTRDLITAGAHIEKLEAALRLWREAYRPYREDMVREALVATDAALSTQEEAPSS